MFHGCACFSPSHQVPDIYDAAKYDAIHNAHLGLPCMHDVYEIAKVLAAAVISNEYGIQPAGGWMAGGRTAVWARVPSAQPPGSTALLLLRDACCRCHFGTRCICLPWR